MVPISDHATRTEYATLHATPGELIGMQDLLYAVLLRSANDGCVAAAEHIGGSEAAFVDLMNLRARELGAVDTHFVTTNGLHDPQHYSTAADLTRIARHAMRYALFNQVVATAEHRISTRSVNRKDTLLKNHNRFLETYAGADGIKTGYVRQSGKCLVASATRLEGNYPWRLLAVVLNSRDTYRDSGALLDYGFRYFQPVFFARQGVPVGKVAVAGGTISPVALVAREDMLAVVRRGAPAATRLVVQASAPRAPLRRDRAVGTAVAYLNGQFVARGELVPARAVAMGWTGKLSHWGGWSLLTLMLLALGPRYARSVAEGARRRRGRVAPRGRSADLGWPGERGWARRTGTWN
jgi:D-alanyl-D-alanine carboxypeptidase (penicillin-binding protein 5/6)